MRVATLIAACLTAAAGAEIRGKVVQDHNGAPVVSAEVRVYTPALVADLESDSYGRFSASGLPDGDYRIVVSKPGFVTSEVIGAGRDVNVRLVRCGAFSGRVTNAASEALRGARVFAMTRTDSGVLRAVPPAAGTAAMVDASGAYRLYNLPPGDYAIAVSWGSAAATRSSGQVPPLTPVGSGVMLYPSSERPKMFAVSGGEEYRGIDFTVFSPNLYSVSGRIESVGTGMKYWTALVQAGQHSTAVAVVPARNDGTFSVEGIPAGSYQLLVTGPVRGYGGPGAMLDDPPVFGRAQVDVVAADVNGISVAVSKARSAVVVLRSAEECPAEGKVMLEAVEDWAASVNRQGVSGAVIPGLAPGRYTVRVVSEGCYQTAPAILDLSGTDGRVVVEMGRGGSIRGQVRPAAPVPVLLLGQSRDVMYVVTADSEGRFEFDGLAPGTYRIAPGKARWIPDLSRMATIEVKAGRGTSMELAVPEQ